MVGNIKEIFHITTNGRTERQMPTFMVMLQKVSEKGHSSYWYSMSGAIKSIRHGFII